MADSERLDKMKRKLVEYYDAGDTEAVDLLKRAIKAETANGGGSAAPQPTADSERLGLMKRKLVEYYDAGDMDAFETLKTAIKQEQSAAAPAASQPPSEQGGEDSLAENLLVKPAKAIVHGGARVVGDVVDMARRVGDYIAPGAAETTKPLSDAIQGVEDATAYERPRAATLAAVKQAFREGRYGDMARNIAAGGFYTAAEAAPEIYAAAKAPLAYLLGNTESNLQARQEANGGKELTAGDVAASVGGAAAETALDRFGGRLVRGASPATHAAGKATRAAGAAAGGVAIDAAGDATEYLAQRAGTDKGVDAPELGDQALEGALFGSVAGAGRRVAGDAVSAAKEVPAVLRAQRELKKNPEKVLSEQRVYNLAKEFEADAVGDGEAAEGPDGASRSMKKVVDRLSNKLRSTADVFYATGAINKAQHKELTQAGDSPIELARKHNRYLGQADLDQVKAMAGLDDGQVRAYQETLADLQTASENSLYKQRRGPVSRAGAMIGAGVGAMVGAKTTGGLGVGAGAMAGKATGENLGAKVDRFFGVGDPPAARRAARRAGVLDRLGVNPGKASEALTDVHALALQRFGDLHGVVVDDVGMARLLKAQGLMDARKAAAAEQKRINAERVAAERQAKAAAASLQKFLANAQKGTMDFMRGEAKRQQATEVEANRAVIGIMARQGAQSVAQAVGPSPEDATRMEGEFSPKQVQAANQRVVEFQRRQALEARRLEEAARREATRHAELQAKEQTLAAAIKANDEQRMALGGSLDDAGVPRAGGWLIESVKRVRENYPTLEMAHKDYEDALKWAIDKGHLTENAAKIALKVPGARLGAKADGLMLAVENEAVLNAARRQGMNLDADGIIKLLYGDKGSAQHRAERKATDGGDGGNSRVSIKGPRRGEGGSEAPRNPQAYGAAITQAKQAADHAVSTAPTPELAQTARDMEGVAGVLERHQVYLKAKEAAVSPEIREWIRKTLYPLTMYGPGGRAVRRAHAKEYGGLHDPNP